MGMILLQYVIPDFNGHRGYFGYFFFAGLG